MGYQIGVGRLGVDRLQLNIINGYQINPYLSLGIGYSFNATSSFVGAGFFCMRQRVLALKYLICHQ